MLCMAFIGLGSMFGKGSARFSDRSMLRYGWFVEEGGVCMLITIP